MNPTKESNSDEVVEGLNSCISFSLPELPAVIRYYDEFIDKQLSVRDPDSRNEWVISVGGTPYHMGFDAFPAEFVRLLKHWCAFQIQNYSPYTARSRHSNLKLFIIDDIRAVITASPVTIRPLWQVLLGKGLYREKEMDSLKSILYFLCKFNLAPWSPEYSYFLSTLPLPAVDKYASVRKGDVFLSVEEEAILIEHFDAMARMVQSHPENLSDEVLISVAILVCSFQFGLRPKQIGMLQMRDVRIWNNVDGGLPSVHLTFKMIKQRSIRKALPLTRKVQKLYQCIEIKGFPEEFQR